MELAEDVGRVGIDPSQLEQIVVNLAVNARDAMPEGGRLRISTDNVVVSPEALRTLDGLVEPSPGSYIRIRVKDTGLGMDEGTCARMFEPFFTTKSIGRGTGLGLSTVYGILKQAGGFPGVRSTVGKGTTVEVYVPRASVDAGKDAPKGSEGSSAGGRETILVVEDELSVRDLVTQILEGSGYRVIAASEAGSAIRAAEARRAHRSRAERRRHARSLGA